MVEREVEWDEDTVARALALTEAEQDICRCGCGLPMSVAHEDGHFQVDKWICYAERNRERVRREWRKKHEDKDGKVPDGLEDGMHWYVTQASAEDIRQDQLSKQRAAEKRRRQREARAARGD